MVSIVPAGGEVATLARQPLPTIIVRTASAPSSQLGREMPLDSCKLRLVLIAG